VGDSGDDTAVEDATNENVKYGEVEKGNDKLGDSRKLTILPMQTPHDTSSMLIELSLTRICLDPTGYSLGMKKKGHD
jgi:hypothetical protein